MNYYPAQGLGTGTAILGTMYIIPVYGLVVVTNSFVRQGVEFDGFVRAEMTNIITRQEV